MIQKPKGTKDIIQDITYYTFLKKTFFEVMHLFNFKEVETPIFEFKKLFTTSISDSEIVDKQMFEFYDRKQRELVLRPENTAGIIRAYNEAKIYLPKQLTKWCYFGPMFRYERPQKGRYRQFYQFGAEIIGDKSIDSDVEIILAISKFLKSLKITKTKLQINFLGSIEERKKYIKELKKFFISKQNQVCQDCQRRIKDNKILRILDCKKLKCKFKDTPLLINFLNQKSFNDYNLIQKRLDNQKISYQKNPFLVRGLDYYSDFVFEIFPQNSHNSQSAIVGGGRYNTLSEKIGGSNVSGIGFAFGVERIINLLKDQNKLPEQKPKLDVLIVYQGLEIDEITKIAHQLRAQNISCDYDKFNLPWKKQFKAIKGSDVVFILKVQKLGTSDPTLQLSNEQTKKVVNVKPIKLKDITKLISKVKAYKVKQKEKR